MPTITDENVKAMTEKSAEVCNGLVVVEGTQLVVSELRKHMDGDLPALLKIFCQGGRSSASVGCIGSIMKSLAASRAKKLIQPLQAEVSGASQSLSELSETLPAQMEAAASAKKAVEELPQKLNRFKEVPPKLKEALAKADPAPVEEILKELRCDELLTALREESKLLAEFLVNAAATREQLSRFSDPKWIRRIVHQLNPVSCCGFSSHPAGEVKTLTETLSKVGELSGRINGLLGSVQQVDEGLRELIRVLEEQLSVISRSQITTQFRHALTLEEEVFECGICLDVKEEETFRCCICLDVKETKHKQALPCVCKGSNEYCVGCYEKFYMEYKNQCPSCRKELSPDYSVVIEHDDKSYEVQPRYKTVETEADMPTTHSLLKRLQPACHRLVEDHAMIHGPVGDDLEALKGLRCVCSANAHGRLREDGNMKLYTGKDRLGMLLDMGKNVSDFYDGRAILLSHPKYRLALSFVQHVESGHKRLILMWDNRANFHAIRKFADHLAAHPEMGAIIKDKMAPDAPASQHMEVLNPRFNRFVTCDTCGDPVKIIGPDVEDRVVGLTCDRENRTIIHPTGYDMCHTCARNKANGTMLSDDEKERRSREKEIIDHLIGGMKEKKHEDITWNAVKAIAVAIEDERIPLPGNSKDYTEAEVTEILQKESR